MFILPFKSLGLVRFLSFWNNYLMLTKDKNASYFTFNKTFYIYIYIYIYILFSIFNNVIYSCDGKSAFQFSVSHDSSEIILICWFAAQEM